MREREKERKKGGVLDPGDERRRRNETRSERGNKGEGTEEERT